MLKKNLLFINKFFNIIMKIKYIPYLKKFRKYFNKKKQRKR